MFLQISLQSFLEGASTQKLAQHSKERRTLTWNKVDLQGLIYKFDWQDWFTVESSTQRPYPSVVTSVGLPCWSILNTRVLTEGLKPFDTSRCQKVSQCCRAIWRLGIQAEWKKALRGEKKTVEIIIDKWRNWMRGRSGIYKLFWKVPSVSKASCSSVFWKWVAMGTSEKDYQCKYV